MQTIQTVEKQFPLLREIFHPSPFSHQVRDRRKSSLTSLIRKQKQLQSESDSNSQSCAASPGRADQPRFGRSSSIPGCESPNRAHDRMRERNQEGEREHSKEMDEEPSPSMSSVITSQVTSSQQLLPTRERASEGLQCEGHKKPESVEQKWEGETRQQRQEDQVCQPDNSCSRHGLITKGVDLLKNMGNQEARQKKPSASRAESIKDRNGYNYNDAEGSRKIKKSQDKVRESSADLAEKKARTESSKSSFFSNLHTRTGLSRKSASRNDEGITGNNYMSAGGDRTFSKEDLKDLIPYSDPEKYRQIPESSQSSVDIDVEDRLRESSRSGSDTDLCSFHSAFENQDMLTEIQSTIKLQQSGNAVEEQKCTEAGKPEITHDLKIKLKSDEVLQTVGASLALAADLMVQHMPSSSPSQRIQANLSQNNSTLYIQDTSTTSISCESVKEHHKEGSSLSSPTEDGVQENSSLTQRLNINTDSIRQPTDLGVDPEAMDRQVTFKQQKSVSTVDLISSLSEKHDVFLEESKPHSTAQRRRKSTGTYTPRLSESIVDPGLELCRTPNAGVKPYPSVQTSYVKTTTRQLSSPHSPYTTPSESWSQGSFRAEWWRSHRQRSCSIASPAGFDGSWYRAFDGCPQFLQREYHIFRNDQSSSRTTIQDIFLGETTLGTILLD